MRSRYSCICFASTLIKERKEAYTFSQVVRFLYENNFEAFLAERYSFASFSTIFICVDVQPLYHLDFALVNCKPMHVIIISQDGSEWSGSENLLESTQSY